MIETSMSDLLTFARCRKRYDFSEVRGWIPRTGSWSMIIGSTYAACMAAGYRAVREFDDSYKTFADDPIAWAERDPAASAARALAFISEAADYAYKVERDRNGIKLVLTREDRELVEDMVRYYWANLGAADLKTIRRVMAVEEPAYIQVGQYVIRNTFDRVVELEWTQDGTTHWESPVIYDDKTVGDTALSLEFLRGDFQMRSYYSAARGKYGKPTRFVHTFVLRDVPPGFGHRSLTTKSGAKRSAKTLESMQRPERYLRVENTPLSDAQIDAFERLLVSMIGDIDRARAEGYFPPSRLKGHYPGCAGCPFEAPCIAELDGREVGAIDLSYIVRGSEEHQALLEGALELETAK